MLLEKFNAVYHGDSVYNLLKNLIWCGYQLVLAIRNQSLKIRKILKNEFIPQVLVSLPEGKTFNDTEIWFQDESRVGQQNA
jgi:hypothetical protein